MRTSVLHARISSLIDVRDVTLICRCVNDDGEYEYRVQAHLRNQMRSGVTLIESGYWYSLRGAEKELMRMIRGARLETLENS